MKVNDVDGDGDVRHCSKGKKKKERKKGDPRAERGRQTCFGEKKCDRGKEQEVGGGSNGGNGSNGKNRKTETKEEEETDKGSGEADRTTKRRARQRPQSGVERVGDR